jgi:hypothetical protein
MKTWPQVGAKVKYKGIHAFWFNDIINNARENLEIDKIYTIRTIKVLSSWCSITLEETDNIVYSLNFFDYEQN